VIVEIAPRNRVDIQSSFFQDTIVNKSTVTVFLSSLLMLATLTCHAQVEVPDQVESGEAGYKIGCSLANSIGVADCGEMPCYHSMELERQRAQEAQDWAQQQAEREYHHSLLRLGDRSATPAASYDCADCSLASALK
jgi:hypothetical protein